TGLLTDSDGNITSHIQGFLTRTTNLLEQGIIPVFVFDGIPPDLKKDTLKGRKESKQKAQLEFESARDLIEDEESSEEIMASARKTMDDMSKRTVSVTKEQNNDIKTLLGLMGIECINAPEEAEAQCASLVRTGFCYAAATEDMDSLTRLKSSKNFTKLTGASGSVSKDETFGRSVL
ncbi:MAG: FEN1 family endonuclease, partial [Nanoarchaeota archaeon]